MCAEKERTERRDCAVNNKYIPEVLPASHEWSYTRSGGSVWPQHLLYCGSVFDARVQAMSAAFFFILFYGGPHIHPDGAEFIGTFLASTGGCIPAYEKTARSREAIQPACIIGSHRVAYVSLAM